MLIRRPPRPLPVPPFPDGFIPTATLPDEFAVGPEERTAEIAFRTGQFTPTLQLRTTPAARGITVGATTLTAEIGLGTTTLTSDIRPGAMPLANRISLDAATCASSIHVRTAMCASGIRVRTAMCASDICLRPATLAPRFAHSATPFRVQVAVRPAPHPAGFLFTPAHASEILCTLATRTSEISPGPAIVLTEIARRAAMLARDDVVGTTLPEPRIRRRGPARTSALRLGTPLLTGGDLVRAPMPVARIATRGPARPSALGLAAFATCGLTATAPLAVEFGTRAAIFALGIRLRGSAPASEDPGDPAAATALLGRRGRTCRSAARILTEPRQFPAGRPALAAFGRHARAFSIHEIPFAPIRPARPCTAEPGTPRLLTVFRPARTFPARPPRPGRRIGPFAEIPGQSGLQRVGTGRGLPGHLVTGDSIEADRLPRNRFRDRDIDRFERPATGRTEHEPGRLAVGRRDTPRTGLQLEHASHIRPLYRTFGSHSGKGHAAMRRIGRRLAGTQHGRATCGSLGFAERIRAQLGLLTAGGSLRRPRRSGFARALTRVRLGMRSVRGRRIESRGNISGVGCRRSGTSTGAPARCGRDRIRDRSRIR